MCVPASHRASIFEFRLPAAITAGMSIARLRVRVSALVRLCLEECLEEPLQ